MKKGDNITARINLKKGISIGVMCFCLLLLTAANFFVYPPANTMLSNALKHSTNTNSEDSPTPVEEKSTAKSGLTVQEEYIHDAYQIKGLSDISLSSEHKIPAEEKLQIVHFELISPPPKS